jgi:hypothetical protein
MQRTSHDRVAARADRGARLESSLLGPGPRYRHYQRRKRNHGSLVTDAAGNYIWQHDSEPQDRAPKATRKKDPQYYKLPVSAAVRVVAHITSCDSITSLVTLQANHPS